MIFTFMQQMHNPLKHEYNEAYLQCLCFVFQSKKRGLSVEEKRTRMMEFFYEKVRFILTWEVLTV